MQKKIKYGFWLFVSNEYEKSKSNEYEKSKFFLLLLF